MRIIHFVCDPLPPGGYQYAVHYLADNLAAMGHEVTLLCRKRRRGQVQSIFEVMGHSYDVREYYLPPSRGLFHGTLGARAIRRAAADLRPDIIHATMGWPCPSWALRAFPSPPPGLVAMFQGGDIQVNPEYGYGLRLDPKIDRQVREVVRRTPGLLTISRSMRRELVAIGAPEERLAVLPNGVDRGLYEGAFPPRPCEEPYVIAMGRLIPKKGYDLLLEAYARAVLQTGSPAHLCIAGEGPLQRDLAEQARRLGIAPRIRFLGYVSGAAKLAWLRHADFFVHPARREPFGIVNVEALAAGLPVVAFGIDGLLDIVSDDLDGYLVEPYRVEDLADRMARLMADPELRQRMSAHSRESSRRFDWKVIAARLEAYYAALLAGAVGAHNPGVAGRPTEP